MQENKTRSNRRTHTYTLVYRSHHNMMSWYPEHFNTWFSVLICHSLLFFSSVHCLNHWAIQPSSEKPDPCVLPYK